MGDFSNRRIELKDIVVVYLDLGDKLGFYRVLPGWPGYICLNTSLLESGAEYLHLTVFYKLLEYHNSIPDDSPYRLFEHVRYFLELLPPHEPTPAPLPAGAEEDQEPLPEIIFIGRFRTSQGRVWTRPEFNPGQYRLVGG